jgi:acyl-coenzyme A thioesterase PaaI-like protein
MTDIKAGDGAVESIALAGMVDEDGFRAFHSGTPGRFFDGFGPIGVRVEGDRVRCRIATGHGQSNIAGNVHGGFIMACVDQVMFCALIAIGRLPAGGAVTLQAATHFIGAAQAGAPIDLIVEILSETGRMLFVRGTIEQADALIGSFDGTLRKVRGPVAA